MTTDSWKLQDAKARFSELVRRARAGEPQHVTVHGEEAVVVVDPKRFDIRPKALAPAEPMTEAPARASEATAPATEAPVEQQIIEALERHMAETPAPTPPAPPPAPSLPPATAVAAAAEEKPPARVREPTLDDAALGLIAELEMELRRLKEP